MYLCARSNRAHVWQERDHVEEKKKSLFLSTSCLCRFSRCSSYLARLSLANSHLTAVINPSFQRPTYGGSWGLKGLNRTVTNWTQIAFRPSRKDNFSFLEGWEAWTSWEVKHKTWASSERSRALHTLLQYTAEHTYSFILAYLPISFAALARLRHYWPLQGHMLFRCIIGDGSMSLSSAFSLPFFANRSSCTHYGHVVCF